MKVLFIGALNAGNSPKGGEEYKNQVLIEKLFSEFNTTIIDTYHWKKKPIVLFRLLLNIFFRRYDSIIISASSVSSYQLIRFLNFYPSKIAITHYFVIGGFFPTGIKEGVFKPKYYVGLKNIIVESISLKNQLKNNGNLENVSVIPNFKKYNYILNKPDFENGTMKFIFISRICEAKGVDLIFEAAEILKKKGHDGQFLIDFYGPIEESYKLKFQVFLSENITYKGYLDLINDSQSAYDVLSKYQCMLFPTFWKGEGFPGVFIDAFISGLPVIASNWNINSDFIINGFNGILLESIDSAELAREMEYLLLHPSMVNQFSKNAYNLAAQYHIDSVWLSIKKVLIP